MSSERSGVAPRPEWRRLQPVGFPSFQQIQTRRLKPAPPNPARVTTNGRDRHSVKAILAGVLLASLPGLCAAPAPAPRTSGRAGFGASPLLWPSAPRLTPVPRDPADTASVFAPDKGKLRIKDSGQLKLSSDGARIRYEWSAQAQKKATGSVDFAGGTAKCSADLGAASPMRKDFSFGSPRIAVLDNNLYYQYGVLARLYDWKAGGKQSFPVLIPQDMVPGTIDVESLDVQQMQKAEHAALRVSTPDLEIILFLDANHRMMRLEVPSSNVTVERE